MSLETLPDSALETQASTHPLNVLLAYDGSSQAQAAIALAQDLFQPCAQATLNPEAPVCRLTAMTVLPSTNISGHEVMQRSLDQACEQLRQRGMRVEAILKAGTPAASINAYAEEIGANLIVIGAQGLRSTLGILLGGVAQQVVEYSNCPVLVVRSPYQGIRRVLAVVDGSTHSRRALEYLAPPCAGQPKQDPAQRCTWLPPMAAIRVLHVLPPPIPYDKMARDWTLGPEVLYYAPIEPIDPQEQMQAEEKQGRELLAEAEAIFTKTGLGVNTVLDRGDAATQILEHAKEYRADLIVCGSRGLSPISGWLLGSVSRKLVHYAGCSVLIVRG